MAHRYLRTVALLVLSLVLLSSTPASETVVFNLHTHKFHCPTCHAAQSCTKNCVKISRADAIKRGGVACKICGGACAR